MKIIIFLMRLFRVLGQFLIQTGGVGFQELLIGFSHGSVFNKKAFFVGSEIVASRRRLIIKEL